MSDDAPVQLWLCRNEDLPEVHAVDLARCWLDPAEQERARRFVFPADRRQYLVAHALVRRVLAGHTGVPESRLRFWRSRRGRPFLSPPPEGWPRGDTGLDFNLSHARGVNVVGTAVNRRIGVDVERLDRDDAESWMRVAESFTAEERRWIDGLVPSERARGVLRLWTLKEAYAKARGLGLSLPFDSFAFVLDGGRRVRRFRPSRDDAVGRWQFLQLEPMASTIVAVAVEAAAGDAVTAHLRYGFPWMSQPPVVLDLPPTPGPPDTTPADREGVIVR
ncbi:4'-phosphopantetheinyl transferase family protein [Couchioplanes azureus]|uniref:4'-phosphopantetheinyl transferase family protein n=1 Tax=Couchioplanes caeruleus TaxID=56438 RepID=UPI001670C2EF|nr:4'-phosphopantetheinyl transferase superfamily protein [Couchioplanes caeruleus]GGQ76259.1 hypothetical protein GCM10010166_53070 [Couchioplanes caeruleus subsp. azureus]